MDHETIEVTLKGELYQRCVRIAEECGGMSLEHTLIMAAHAMAMEHAKKESLFSTSIDIGPDMPREAFQAAMSSVWPSGVGFTRFNPDGRDISVRGIFGNVIETSGHLIADVPALGEPGYSIAEMVSMANGSSIKTFDTDEKYTGLDDNAESAQVMTENVENAENEKICEWLGWTLVARTHDGQNTWQDSSGNCHEQPTFRTGNDMQLMLNQLASLGLEPTLEYSDGKWGCYGGDPHSNFFHAYAETAPDAVRAAVLEIIGEAKS